MSKTYYRTLESFLQAALRDEVTPIIYFDTNVIVDIIDSRNQASLTLFEFLVQEKWELITSIFAKVEIYEIKQINEFLTQNKRQKWTIATLHKKLHQRDLCNATLSRISAEVTSQLHPIIEHFRPYTHILEEGWTIAEDIKQSTNLTDKDSIHLAEALAGACDVLLSRDRQLVKVARDRIWAETPERIAHILGIPNKA